MVKLIVSIVFSLQPTATQFDVGYGESAELTIEQFKCML